MDLAEENASLLEQLKKLFTAHKALDKMFVKNIQENVSLHVRILELETEIEEQRPKLLHYEKMVKYNLNKNEVEDAGNNDEE
jgi:hypothetical protein